jgi:diguanylate cyclase (GGDEF)-like protein
MAAGRFSRKGRAGAGDSARSLYALQRRIGFSWLSFLHPLEREYQTAQMKVVVARSIRLYMLALFGLMAAVALNRFVDRHFLSPRGEQVMIATIALLVFPFSLSVLPAFRPHFRRFLLTVFWVFGTGVNVATALSRAEGASISESGLALIVLAGYFLSSMRLWEAVVFGTLMTAGYLITGIRCGLPRPDIADAAYFLTVANLLGLLGYYYVDYSARMNFLLRNELEELAYCDGLTGLLNRRAFYRHLRSTWRQAERNGCAIGIALIDMDNLKQVNDTRGHGEGDRCLRLIGGVLAELAQRPLDGIARLGGDEFAGVWFDVDEQWFTTLAEVLRERLKVESEALGIPEVSVSVGKHRAQPQAGTNPFDALKAADAAMYRVKRGRPLAAE